MKSIFRTGLIIGCLLSYSLCIPASGKPALLPFLLDGKTILFSVDPQAAEDNPNFGKSYRMSFTVSNYSYVLKEERIGVLGHYKYSRYGTRDNPVAHIIAHESYKGEDSDFELVLMPRDEFSGMFLFRQNSGPIKPDRRMNSGHYEFLVR